MVKYRFTDKKPNHKQRDEVEEHLRDRDFIKLLTMTKEYYIQGYNGDYGFKVIDTQGGIKVEIKLF